VDEDIIMEDYRLIFLLPSEPCGPVFPF